MIDDDPTPLGEAAIRALIDHAIDRTTEEIALQAEFFAAIVPDGMTPQGALLTFARIIRNACANTFAKPEEAR